MARLHIIDAEVLGEIKGGYRLKISLVDLGVYIFGIRAVHSAKETSGWWVQPPASRTSSGWKANPEFDKKKDLWREIEQSCVEAIQLYAGDTHEEVMSEEGFDKAFGVNKPDPFSPTGELS